MQDVDVRIVAATHTDLLRRVEEGSFGQDLFYCLNAFTLTVPPLRERRADMAALAEHFLSRFEHHYQRRTLGFSDQARSAMAQYLTADHKRITEKALFGDYRVPTLEREKGQGLDASGMLEVLVENRRSGRYP